MKRDELGMPLGLAKSQLVLHQQCLRNHLFVAHSILVRGHSGYCVLVSQILMQEVRVYEIYMSIAIILERQIHDHIFHVNMN